jgi:DNA polymerase-3 subunit delta
MARAPKPAPVQAIVGEDSYLAEAALERLLTAAVGQERQESVSVLYGDESRWEDVLAAARAGSLFAPQRAVVVRRAELLKYANAPQEEPGRVEAAEGREPKKGKAASGRKPAGPGAAGDPVEAYLASPAADATLILLAARPDRRKRPWKSLLSAAEVHDAAPRKGRALRMQVEQELRERGLRFSREALDQLIEEVGQDLRRLMGEVDKLEAWAEGRKQIGEDDVAAVLGHGLGQPTYLLSDAFAARDAARTLELVDELMSNGEPGVLLIAVLHRALRQVRAAAALQGARVPRQEIGARLLPPHMQFKLDSLLEAARRWSEPELARAVAALARVDREVKQGAPAEVALAAAVAAACSRATSPVRAT